MNITLQCKYTSPNIENIWEPAETTGVDIQALGNDLGPLRNTSHDVKNNYDSLNIWYYIANQANLHNYWNYSRTSLGNRGWHPDPGTLGIASVHTETLPMM